MHKHDEELKKGHDHSMNNDVPELSFSTRQVLILCPFSELRWQVNVLFRETIGTLFPAPATTFWFYIGLEHQLWTCTHKFFNDGFLALCSSGHLILILDRLFGYALFSNNWDLNRLTYSELLGNNFSCAPPRLQFLQ